MLIRRLVKVRGFRERKDEWKVEGEAMGDWIVY
jgi:hypothetical protein